MGASRDLYGAPSMDPTKFYTTFPQIKNNIIFSNTVRGNLEMYNFLKHQRQCATVSIHVNDRLFYYNFILWNKSKSGNLQDVTCGLIILLEK